MEVKVAIITISDKVSKGLRKDENKEIIEKIISRINGKIVYYKVIPDEKYLIEKEIIYCADIVKVDLILTNGGTGFSKRDVTPEATKNVIEKEIPGIPEAMRYFGLQYTKRAMLSRAIAGIRKDSIIINLPGSSTGVEQSLNAIIDELPHGLEMIQGKEH